MNTSRSGFAAIWNKLGAAPSTRRARVSPSAPACEALEGRRLLTGGTTAVAATTAATAAPTPPTPTPADVAGQTDPGPGSNQPGTAHDIGDWGQGGPGEMHADRYEHPAMMGGPAAMGRRDGFGGSRVDFGGSRRGPGGPDGSQGDNLNPDSGTPADRTQLTADREKLRTDEQAIHDKSQVTPAMEATVRNDLKTIKGAITTTADATALATLQTDIQAARTNQGGPTDDQLAQIDKDQDAVFLSQGVNQALLTKLDTDRAAIQTARNITADDQATLTADRAAIQADLAKIAPSINQATTTSGAATTTGDTSNAVVSPPPVDGTGSADTTTTATTANATSTTTTTTTDAASTAGKSQGPARFISHGTVTRRGPMQGGHGARGHFAMRGGRG